MTNKKKISSSEKGFALAAVLWILAGLSVVVAAVSDFTHSAAERNALLRMRNNFLLNSLSARSEIQYFISIATPGSSEFKYEDDNLYVDGTLYKFDDNVFFNIQDHGGLVDISSINRDFLKNFLNICGVELDKSNYLIDALEDYSDSDNLQRINGAENEAYVQAGLFGPRNSSLLEKDEVWSVYGWQEFEKLFKSNGCSDEMTIYGEVTMLGTSLNLATSPSRVLKASGLSSEQVQDIDNARRDPLKLAERIANNNQLIGSDTGSFGRLSGKYVQRTLTINHFSNESPWKWSYILQVDSTDADRPWRILNSEILPADKTKDNELSFQWPL